MSTRQITADRRFCGLLAEDFPVLPLPTIERALLGRPQRQAIALCGWAAERTSDPARALLAWARRQPATLAREVSPEPSPALSTVREGTSTPRSGWASRPAAGILAGLERMAS